MFEITGSPHAHRRWRERAGDVDADFGGGDSTGVQDL